MEHPEDTAETIEISGTPWSNQSQASSTTSPTKSLLDRFRTSAIPRVRLLAGSAGGFSNETASLLRTRLAGYATITFAVLAVGFASTLLNPQPLWTLRIIVLSIMLAAIFWLRSKHPISLLQLRWVEFVLVTALLLQVCSMTWLRIAGFVDQSDLPSTVAASQFFHTLICLVILAYGIFIPNSWQRATLVLVPIASLPLVILSWMGWTNAEFASMMLEHQLIKPIPETFVAAGIAIFGSHVIQGARREAFEARQLGQYVLGKRIGAGGMGEVYEAEHRMLKRPCAIKLIRPDSESNAQAIDRFETEVRATAKLSHWNSVEVYDYGRTDDGTFYYAMELLPGATLEELVQRYGPMPPGRTIHFLVQVCDALSEAHSRGLIHRDIKPANIFAADRGGIVDVAKLLDFGLVRQSQDKQGESSRFSGTPAYMPPEQATDYEQVDARGDIYALGAVAHYLLTGKPPFDGSIAQILWKHRTQTPESVRAIRPDVSSELDSVIQTCLQKSPDDRYRSAADLRQALDDCKESNDWSQSDAADWWKTHGAILWKEPDELKPEVAQTTVIPETLISSHPTTD